MARSSHRPDPFSIAALCFGVLAAWNTSLGVLRYGIEQGMYWWFCNLALIGTSVGLWRRSRALLIAFLAVASFTQVFWIVDNLFRLLTGTNAFGLVEYMYRPGIPWDEFLLTHYHYLTIPVCLVALYFLPRPRTRWRSLAVVAVLNPVIFGVSYFLFPESQNVNCIHAACIAGVSWSGPLYSWGFWAVVFAGNLLLAVGYEHLFANLERSPARSRRLKRSQPVFAAIVLGLCIWDSWYKTTLPNLVCEEPTESVHARIGCTYTLDHSAGNLTFGYRVTNKTESPIACRTQARTPFTTIQLDENLPLSPRSSLSVKKVLPYPDVNVRVELTAVCHEVGLPLKAQALRFPTTQDAR